MKFGYWEVSNYCFYQAKSASSTAQNYASQAANKAREGKLIEYIFVLYFISISSR